MILNKLSVKGFGKLKNINIDLKPGLNIIYGKNESGKSTLLTFIKGIFYGLNKKAKKDEISEFEKYEPWSSDEFSGMIEYEHNGANYKVGRNFKTNKVSLCNEFWDDITDKFPKDKKKGCLFAEDHLGFSEDCFERTILVRQLESRVRDTNKELVDKLINVQQTGSEDISYIEAIKLLENALKDKIGSNKTKKKPINVINDEILNLEREKNEVGLLRNEVLGIQEEIKNKTEQKDKIIDKINNNNELRDFLKKQDLLENYNTAREYETKLEDIENQIGRLKQYEKFPVNLQEQLKEIIINLKNYNDSLQEKNETLNEIETEIKNFDNNLKLNNSNIYEINMHLEILKSALNEKIELQDKLKLLNTELDDLNVLLEQFKSDEDLSEDDEVVFVNYQKQLNFIQNKINQINEIRDDIKKINNDVKNISVEMISDNNVSNKISMFDIESVKENYEKLDAYKESINSLESEIQDLKNKINNSKQVINDLAEYDKLPADIEQKVEKLNKKYGDNTLENILFRKNKRNLLFSIIFFSLTLVLLAYSFFKILFSFSNITYFSIGLGVICYIFAILNYGHQKQNNNNDQEKNELQQIYESVHAKNYKQFMKNLEKYNEYSKQVLDLELQLKQKIDQKEDIKSEYNCVINEICKLLDLFSVKYSKNEINKNHIILLKENFISKVEQINEHYSTINFNNLDEQRNKWFKKIGQIAGREVFDFDDVNKIILELEDEKHKINYIKDEFITKHKSEKDMKEINKLNQKVNIVSKIENKQNQIKFIKENIQKNESKIKDIDFKIKSIMDANSIKYDKNNFITLNEIPDIKSVIEKMLEHSDEVSKLNTIKENIILEISKIEESKKALESDKNKILEEALVKSEEDFFDSCNKNSDLNEFIREKNRIQKMYDEILKGENSEQILEKVTSFQNISIDFDDVSHNSIEELDKKLDDLKNELKLIDEELLNLKNEENKKLNGKMDLNEIVEKIEILKSEKEKLDTKKEALNVTIDVIKEVAEQIQKDFSPRFQKEMSEIICKVTDGKYTQVKANDKLNLNVISPDSGQIVPVDKLSQGTIDQLYLGLRIALSNLLNKNDEKLPLIIDEAFVQYDDTRVRNVLECLVEESKQRQIILFTCQKREIEIIKELNLDSNIKVIELI